MSHFFRGPTFIGFRVIWAFLLIICAEFLLVNSTIAPLPGPANHSLNLINSGKSSEYQYLAAL